ncbi:pectate lyase [Pseudalgibacter alginicilyticus]|uniref:Pectate lyase n=1 Tax=Pseudalgibacter alginicilyticus TaxID=1736674 RepID=A0A0P0DD40_9FLAO|nr:pectate lyase [Pseudalgibacter alginicilyticus]ALJ05937.1 pectate lyase [Pseudalgibacter alginicilyticus]
MKIYYPIIVIALLLFSACGSDSPDEENGGEGQDGPTAVVEEALAFPGAEGFGKNTTGGRGGRVIYVTNLQDSGSGSLRSAIQASGPRYILFKVSGTIALRSDLKIENGDVTIAGQTAPGDGICIKNYPVTINTNNVIIRYLRFRMGDEAQQEDDALGARFQENIVVDHCSMSWSTDECASFYNNTNTTIQWCMISESLTISVHDKGAHGYGGIWGGKYASFHHNLLAHHDARNPRLSETTGSSFSFTDLTDLRNNVIYNWGSNSTYGGEGMNANIVNNYYKPGPRTFQNTALKEGRIFAMDKTKVYGYDNYDVWGKFYIDGNYVDGYPNSTNDNWTYGVYNQFHASYTSYTNTCTDSNGYIINCGYSIPVTDEDKAAMKLSEPHDIENNVTTHTAEIAYNKVLDYAGASLVRDVVDIRVVNDVRTGTYQYEGSEGSTLGLIDSQADVGGWPELISEPAPVDTSGDGMPDAWKIEKKLNVSESNPNGNDLSTGYDNVEVYINSLVENITNNQI